MVRSGSGEARATKRVRLIFERTEAQEQHATRTNESSHASMVPGGQSVRRLSAEKLEFTYSILSLELQSKNR